jgi:hypothetical protein
LLFQFAVRPPRWHLDKPGRDELEVAEELLNLLAGPGHTRGPGPVIDLG